MRSIATRSLLTALILSVAMGLPLADRSGADPASTDCDATTNICNIAFPVLGPVFWTDTFGAPRDGHFHEGQDLMGQDHITVIKGQLQPLLATVDGTITYTGSGYLQLTGADGWRYCYMHLNNDTPGTDDGLNPPRWMFAPGIARGVKVIKGQVVGYMGDSGNAEAAGTHLHFEIRTPGTSACSGGAINGAESLRQATHIGPTMPDTAWAPFPTAEALVMQQYKDFLGREADQAGLAFWIDKMTATWLTVPEAMQAFMDSKEFGATAAPIDRLYSAYFLRLPDFDGLKYWISQFQRGDTLSGVSSSFASSVEFSSRYGDLDSGSFVDLVYKNVLGREADPDGRSYWTNRMADGQSRGGLMIGFSESPEYRAAQRAEVYVTMAYIGMLDRAPEQAGFDYWVAQVEKGASVTKLLQLFLGSAEYAKRVSPPPPPADG